MDRESRGQPRWRQGNRIALLRSGEAYFPALLQAIADARQEVFLESYLYRDDATGRRVTAALIWAARRGVRVQVLLDGFGTRDLPQRLRQVMARAGVRLLFFHPNHWRIAFSRQRLHRLHHKLVVVDSRLGFVGGLNIVDDIDRPGDQPRYDHALRIEGPLVQDLRRAAVAQWRATCRRQLRRQWLRVDPGLPMPEPVGDMPAALLLRDNVRHRRDIERAYLRALDEAEEEVLIANAYFLPGVRFRRHLVAAARRGVRVRLCLQGRMEVPLEHQATHALYRSLLKAGVEIYEYHAGYMHAKVAVVDGRWLTVGSSNIDPVSLLLNWEANVMVRDETLAGQLRADLLEHMERDAVVIQAADLDGASWWRRALPWLAYQLLRLATGLTGYRGRTYFD